MVFDPFWLSQATETFPKALARCESVGVADSAMTGARLKGFKLMGAHLSPYFTSSHLYPLKKQQNKKTTTPGGKQYQLDEFATNALGVIYMV